MQIYFFFLDQFRSFFIQKVISKQNYFSLNDVYINIFAKNIFFGPKLGQTCKNKFFLLRL